MIAVIAFSAFIVLTIVFALIGKYYENRRY